MTDAERTNELLERVVTLLDARAPASRLTYSIAEAAALLGVSRDFLTEHVLPDLRIVYVGRKRLIPASELTRWIGDNATKTLAG